MDKGESWFSVWPKLLCGEWLWQSSLIGRENIGDRGLDWM